MSTFQRLGRKTALISWIAQLTGAAILLQTLFFKFTGAEESVYIFSRLGMEPAGRIGTGVAELIAAVLLLWPPTALLGGLMTAGLMSGAVFFHLTQLGIVVLDDGGTLFALASIALVAGTVAAACRWRQFFALWKRVRSYA